MIIDPGISTKGILATAQYFHVTGVIDFFQSVFMCLKKGLGDIIVGDRDDARRVWAFAFLKALCCSSNRTTLQLALSRFIPKRAKFAFTMRTEC